MATSSLHDIAAALRDLATKLEAEADQVLLGTYSVPAAEEPPPTETTTSSKKS